MNDRPLLDARVGQVWAQFARRPAAVADREIFLAQIHRSNWGHVYPPPVFTAEAAAELGDLAERLARLVTSMPERVFGGDLPAWLDYLGVPAKDAMLMRAAMTSPRLRRAATSFMRPDLLVTAAGPKLVELNVSTPMGGMSTLPAYTAAAQDSAFGRLLAERGLPIAPSGMARIWLDSLGRLVGRRESPRRRRLRLFEAIANPADVDSGRPFFVDLVRSGGYDISCGLVSELELSEDGVRHEGQPIDIVFTMYTWHESKRFVPPELTARLIELDTARVVDFIGSPAAALFDDKANLELLTEFEEVLDDSERELVRASVPTTFRLREATLDRAIRDRERLVCKPASAYGGVDIGFGPAMTDTEWGAVLRRRLADPRERYVCQELVPPMRVDLPGREPAGREVVLGPLVFGGRTAGIFLRESAPVGHAPINVKQGAEAAAVLTVADR
ncbi:hypothetical protein ILP97_07570 [Amycolatopsis sp. H6(2020)]|nr:hypothetical protein [Amycolatopsis sp. H6(2020)]